MIKADKNYIDTLRKITTYGSLDRDPRPRYKDGTPAHTKFITQTFEKYDISNGEFPIPTLRNTAIKIGIKEIFWIYQNQSNKLSDAHDLGIDWWDEWDVGDGTIGMRYGATVKQWGLMDRLLEGMEKDPFSRRHYIELLQENDLMLTKGLHPCAHLTEWSVREFDGNLYVDMSLIQRSNDYITAGYINKIQYVGFMLMVCGHLGYRVGNFSHFTQNSHIYDRHINAANEILNRTPLTQQPELILDIKKDFYDYKIDDFKIKGINGIEKIKSELEIAV